MIHLGFEIIDFFIFEEKKEICTNRLYGYSGEK